LSNWVKARAGAMNSRASDGGDPQRSRGKFFGARAGSRESLDKMDRSSDGSLQSQLSLGSVSVHQPIPQLSPLVFDYTVLPKLKLVRNSHF
jgi:hypothetical protein